MGLFTKRKTVPVGPPPPVSNNTFVEPPLGENAYVSVAGLGGPPGTTWAPTADSDYRSPGFNAKYRLEPPPDQAPGPFYAERNRQNLERGAVEHIHGTEWSVVQFEKNPAQSPERFRPPNGRVSGSQSPSTYRFTLDGLPLGLKEPRHLNGNHYSGASMVRAYPINGMQPATHFRNTYRVPPPEQGNPGITDLPPAQGTDVRVEVVSASLSPSFRSHRLGS